MKVIKKALKILLDVGFVLLLLLAIVWILLQQPKVQTWSANKITTYLSESLSTKISVDQVNISFFNSVALNGIYIEDQQQDTLLFAEALSAEIGLFSLFSKKIFLDQIQLKNANVNFNKNSGQEVYNFDFLLQAFQPKPGAPKSKWTFGIGKILLQQSRFSLIDETIGSDLFVFLGKFSSDIDQLNLEENKIDLNDVELFDSSVKMVFGSGEKTQSMGLTKSESKPLVFPEIPWEITADSFSIKNNTFSINDKGTRPKMNKLDFAHLDLNEISGAINNFEWRKKSITASIDQFKVQEKNGFAVQNLELTFAMDSTGISSRNLKIKTNRSQIHNNTTIAYNAFADLARFNQAIDFETHFLKSKIAVADLKLFITDWENMTRLPDNQFIEIDGIIKGTPHELKTKNLKAYLPNLAQVHADALIKNYASSDKMEFDIQLKQLSTSYDQLKSILPSANLPVGLRDFGKFTLQMKAAGKLSDFRAENVELATAANTAFLGNIHLTGLPDLQALVFEIDAKNLKTLAQDWAGFFKGPVPGILDSLGFVQYIGLLNGNMKTFESTGSVHSSIGQLQSDLVISFNKDYSSATYAGDLYLDNFNLGKALADTLGFGMATVKLVGNGSGLKLDSLEAKIKAVVEQIELKGYQYHNLSIAGDFKQQEFNGEANFQDENAALDFNGYFNLNDSIPEFRFTMNVDTLDLKALNLGTNGLRLSGKTKMNFRGNSLANIDGSIVMTDLIVSDSSQTLTEDSLFLESRQLAFDSKILAFHSDFLNAKMEGNFDLDLMNAAIRNFVNDYFPILLDTAFEQANAERLDQQNFKFDIELTDARPFIYTNIPELSEIENAQLEGQFNYQERNLDLKASIIGSSFQNIRSDSIFVLANASEKLFKTNINAISFEGKGVNIPLLNIQTNLSNDSLNLKIDAQDNNGNHNLTTSGVATYKGDNYVFHFDPNLVINDEKWGIEKENALYFAKKFLFIDQFIINKDDHKISVQSDGSPANNRTSPIKLSFSDYNLSEIMGIIGQDLYQMEGLINGQIKLLNIFENFHFDGNLRVDDFAIENDTMGNVKILTQQQKSDSEIGLELVLKGNENDISFNGQYVLAENRYNLKGEIKALQMQHIDVFTKGIVSDSEGNISGDITLRGTPEKPDLQGEILIQNVATTIDYFQTKLIIPEHKLYFDEKKIAIGSMQLQGEHDKTAKLSGNIKHQFFSNWNLDLAFQTDDFKLLNTTEKNNSLYWGTIFLKTDFRINGSFSRPVINVNATTLPKSIFFIQTLLEEDLLADAPYLIYGNPDEINLDSLIHSEKELRVKNPAKLDLQMNLLATPDAELQLIIDPISGDRVTARGNSSMTIKLNPAGELSILGDYFIESGQYRFTYGQFIKKEFTIESGSKVSFSGDPLKSKLDIVASYTTYTSTADLVRNETAFSDADLAEARQRTTVKTLLKLKGDLLQPNITFDIQLPDNEGNLTNSVVSRKLIQLRNDPAEMNKQVFALLLFNNFFPSSNSGNLLVGAGENLALSSVSKLISNQLNKLAESLIKGIDITIGLGSYRTQDLLNEGNQSNITEFQLELEKRLFDNRVTIRVGADVGLNNSASSDVSNVAGDFVIEVKLTKNGNYLLKVYRRSDFDILKDENTSRNGVGVSAKKSFGKKGKKK